MDCTTCPKAQIALPECRRMSFNEKGDMVKMLRRGTNYSEGKEMS